jgi:Uncharacterized protein conserved in bacteria
MQLRYAVFLRGVMPSGKNRVPMAELRSILEKNGFTDVKTYIQSGNVILSSAKSKEAVEKSVESLIKKHLGGDIPCVAKTLKEMKTILKKNPFSEDQQAHTCFTFFKQSPVKAKVNEFMKTDFAPDEVKIIGDVLYIRFNTKQSDSKFNNNLFEKRLNIQATSRNYNTTSKMLELVRESQSSK